MIFSAAYVLYLGLLPATCVLALWKGGRDAHRVTVALILGVLASQIAFHWGEGLWREEVGVMVVDAALFVALTAIAHRSDRFWPIWAAAAQFGGLATHLVTMIQPYEAGDIYKLAQRFWIFPIMAAIAWGTWSHWKRTSSRSP